MGREQWLFAVAEAVFWGRGAPACWACGEVLLIVFLACFYQPSVGLGSCGAYRGRMCLVQGAEGNDGCTVRQRDVLIGLTDVLVKVCALYNISTAVICSRDGRL